MTSDSRPEAAPTATATAAPAPELQDRLVSSARRLTVNGRELAYTATAGTYVLHDEPGRGEAARPPRPRAELFTVSYTLDEGPGDATRPVTFVFNGGPGSSSTWLHLGLLGPRRVVMGDAGALVGPPWTLTDNEFTLLTHSDLVFIDPVGTGHSRAAGEAKGEEFYGFEADLDAVAALIRLWTSRQGRWGAPKYLLGESYGTTRAAALSQRLQDTHNMHLAGVVLVSSILDFSTVDESPGHDLSYPLMLPSYAATAWYHGAVSRRRSLNAVLKDAESLADGEYLNALHRGARLPERERRRVATRLAALIGLDERLILRHDLRVGLERFRTELLRERGRVVGRLDTRFTAAARDGGAGDTEADASYSAIQGPYGAAINMTLHELGWSSDRPYELLTPTVWPWDYTTFQNRHVRVHEPLRRAMTANPQLRVLVASGVYDCATPYHATRHTLDHLGGPPELRGRVREHVYSAGHMMYVHAPSLAQQKADLAAFYEAGQPVRPD